jgi:uncharacterized cupredoxin-like copper-binding protein
MIRVFVVVALVGGLIIAYLTTLAVGPIAQLPPSQSLLTDFRAEGYVPASVNLAIDETPEDLGVFTVPEQDAVHLAQAEAAAATMSSGMDMSGSGDATTDGGTAMTNADGSAMDMSGSGDATADGGTAMTNADGSTMDMSGSGDAAAMPMPKAEGGLAFAEDGAFDREIVLTMAEWKFSEMAIDVKPGERIKFTVKNGGQIPHEFMFMSPPLMNAVTYRSTRADWNLFEHEALYERALVLPGGEFTFVMEVQEAGSWMFMCMLPYHMQMGMMGQMSTPGMAMDM